MSLATPDLLDSRLQAIEDGIKELYSLVNANTVPFDKKFAKLSPEQKVRKLHTALLAVAKQLNVEL